MNHLSAVHIIDRYYTGTKRANTDNSLGHLRTMMSYERPVVNMVTT